MATVVFVHAHPDDEALLTAGTMRGLHQAGHQVVLIMATDGAAGLTSQQHQDDLASTRAAELQASARVLGVSEVHWLGYADSGLHGEEANPNSLCKVDFEQAAERLAQLLRQANADAVVGYDSHGGYGHPDHVQVHKLVRRAATICAVPNVLEATVDRQLIAKAIERTARLISFFGWDDLFALADGFSARADIAYTVDVRRWISPKRAAMRAHLSQAVGGDTPRTLQVMVKLPRWLFVRVLGREWYRVVRENEANPFMKLPQR